MARLGNRGKVRLHYGGPVGFRAASSHLYCHILWGIGVLHPMEFKGVRVVGYEIPVVDKNQVHCRHRGAYEAQLAIIPRTELGVAIHILVGNIHPPHVPDDAIDYCNLPVVAVIETVSKIGESHPLKLENLHTRLLEFTHIALAQSPATHSIVEYAYIEASPGFSHQEFGHYRPYGVSRPDIVLQMDEFSCRFNVGKQSTESLTPLVANLRPIAPQHWRAAIVEQQARNRGIDARGGRLHPLGQRYHVGIYRFPKA